MLIGYFIYFAAARLVGSSWLVKHLKGRQVVAGQGGAGFEGEEFAFVVDLGGGGMADEAAEVEEVLLGGGAFFELGVLPFLDELLGGDGCRHGALLATGDGRSV